MNRKTLLAGVAALGTLVVIVILDTAGGGRNGSDCCEPLLTSARAVKSGATDQTSPAGGAAPVEVRLDDALRPYPSTRVHGARHVARRDPDDDDGADGGEMLAPYSP
jgi:hypothetical protein